MSGDGQFPLRQAFEIASGRAVYLGAEPGVLCLKAQRRAKNYVQDYVVRLAPAAEPEILLEFVDPETPLADSGAGLTIVPGTAAAPDAAGRLAPPRPGDLVATEAGLFLAVRELAIPHRFVSFVQVESGEVRRLRAHAITALFTDWRLAEDGD